MSISDKHWQLIEKSLKNIFMSDLVFTYQNHEIIVSKLPYSNSNGPVNHIGINKYLKASLENIFSAISLSTRCPKT